jgi:hypothetical protein
MGGISDLSSLEAGDQVLFCDRKRPLTVHSVREIDERDYGIQYVLGVDLQGPQCGHIVLKQSTLGRIMAFKQGTKPGFTPKRLRRYAQDR